MQNLLLDSPNSKWFIRLDSEEHPTSLMIYNFVGAKFEAHQVPLNNSEKVYFWIGKIYHLKHIREIFEQIIFDADYPNELFDKFLPELCRIRDLEIKK